MGNAAIARLPVGMLAIDRSWCCWLVSCLQSTTWPLEDAIPMIVSWNWLKEYVLLDMPAAELERRLMMAGLNHESTEEVGGDLAIDLEVTSNRPDCLGHIGVAREVSVLFDHPLRISPARPREGSTKIAELAKVSV